MALTYTPDGDLGSSLPDFHLPSVDGKTFSPKDFSDSRVLVVMFMCNHCPYVQAIEDRLLDLAKRQQPKGVAFTAICANDPSEHPEDAPAALLQRWQQKKYPFPYLVDKDQRVAKAFGAVCTPDFFVYDQNRKLAYRGRLDDSWKNPAAVTRRELETAVTALLSGQRPLTLQNPSMGCSIKWSK
ncbi:MAG: thioredoxin family protein [Bdellovibrionales bacterium]